MANRRLVLVTIEYEGKNAFTNLQKAMHWLETNHKVIFLDSYRTITEMIKHKPYKFKNTFSYLFGDVEVKIERIDLK
jgi:hypothetical protein